MSETQKLKPSDFYRDHRYTVDDFPYYNLMNLHLPIIRDFLGFIDYDTEIAGLEIRNHFMDCPDDRRGLWISSYWFNEKPFALTYRYGREGDDGGNEYITDEETFREFLNYLLTLWTNAELSIRFDAEEDSVIPMEIYGYDLSRFKK